MRWAVMLAGLLAAASCAPERGRCVAGPNGVSTFITSKLPKEFSGIKALLERGAYDELISGAARLYGTVSSDPQASPIVCRAAVAPDKAVAIDYPADDPHYVGGRVELYYLDGKVVVAEFHTIPKLP